MARYATETIASATGTIQLHRSHRIEATIHTAALNSTAATNSAIHSATAESAIHSATAKSTHGTAAKSALHPASAKATTTGHAVVAALKVMAEGQVGPAIQCRHAAARHRHP